MTHDPFQTWVAREAQFDAQAFYAGSGWAQDKEVLRAERAARAARTALSKRSRFARWAREQREPWCSLSLIPALGINKHAADKTIERYERLGKLMRLREVDCIRLSAAAHLEIGLQWYRWREGA
jgi:hypothetical protein